LSTSTDNTKTTCERYPTHYVGFPKDLKLISYGGVGGDNVVGDGSY